MTTSRRSIISALAAFVLIWLYTLFMPIVYKKDGDIYYLKAGSSKSTVATQLSDQGLIRFKYLFYVYAFFHKSEHLKTGEYLFQRYSSPISIWQQLVNGTGLYYRRFTVVPGRTFTQIRQELAQTTTLKPLTVQWSGAQIMTSLGAPVTLSPEGQFFPETYYYTRDTLDLVILKRAYDLMQNRLNEAWEHRAQGLPYADKNQALTAASLIEKEAYLETERPLIAGVIINRLKKNMLLQIDPTVIYGLGTRYDGKIYKKDLLENTPYNTYVRKGLPPTPIAMPSMPSIEAAMHPQQHDFLYFVARGDGSHQFSKTLPEHNAAVNAANKLKVLEKPL